MANKTTLLQDLSDGLIDAALVHDVSDDGALWINPVALDGLGILVHPDNPVSELSRTQVRGLFSGMYQSWSEVGGRDRPITLIVREEGSGAREIFDQRIMDGRSPNPLSFIAPGSNSMTDLISNDEGAIGFGLLGSTGSVKILSIEGMAPSPEKLSAQEYPLTVPLYFVSLQEPQGRLREFLAWLQSSVGQETLGVQYGRVR